MSNVCKYARELGVCRNISLKYDPLDDATDLLANFIEGYVKA
jgi:hypothetical protein